MSVIDLRIDVDDCFPEQVEVFHRRTNSMPFLFVDGWNIGRNINAYTKLPDDPLILSVLKLDGTSFEIAVGKSATVADLKEAVEHAFSYMPRKGPGKISWPHVWGHFCLSFDGRKLLKENAYIGHYGIADGDQLEFIQHVSPHHIMKRSRSRWIPTPELRRIKPLLPRMNSKKDSEQHDEEVDFYNEAENGRCNHFNEMGDFIIKKNGPYLHLISKECPYSRLPAVERMKASEPSSYRSSCGIIHNFKKMIHFCLRSKLQTALRDH